MGRYKDWLHDRGFFDDQHDWEHLGAEEVFQAWQEQLTEQRHDELSEAGLLNTYWSESLVYLGSDTDYVLNGDPPGGEPYNLAEALRALGIAPRDGIEDWILWSDLVGCGHIHVVPVLGHVVAYYRHPALDQGVPLHLRDDHPHEALNINNVALAR